MHTVGVELLVLAISYNPVEGKGAVQPNVGCGLRKFLERISYIDN